MANWEDMAGVGFEGMEEEITTFQTAVAAADLGKLVKISANATVALCAAEDNFIGQLKNIDGNGIGGVKTGQFFTSIVYTGAAPALGYVELVANAVGGVKVPAVAGTGRKFFVVSKDTDATTVDFMACCC